MTPIDSSRFDELATLQNAFNDASADGGTGNFEPPPDGTYQAMIDGFDFFESKDGDQLFLKTEITVHHHPDHSGRRADTVHRLDDPDRLDWLKKHLAAIGVDVDNLDLAQIRPGSPVLAAVCDTPVEINVKTSAKTDKDGKPYRNVYVNQALGTPMRSDIPSDAPSTPVPVPQAGGDPIPF